MAIQIRTKLEPKNAATIATSIAAKTKPFITLYNSIEDLSLLPTGGCGVEDGGEDTTHLLEVVHWSVEKLTQAHMATRRVLEYIKE